MKTEIKCPMAYTSSYNCILEKQANTIMTIHNIDLIANLSILYGEADFKQLHQVHIGLGLVLST